MSGAVLFYVQHLLGIGHLRRALRLVSALAEEGIAVTLVSGGEPLDELHESGAARVVQLPALRSPDASFKSLVDHTGAPVTDALWQAREAALLAALAAARPDIVMFETYPFGRSRFWGEIDRLIAAARAARPGIALFSSVRDIVVLGDRPERRRAIVERVHADIDAVLVHGDPAFIPLDESFPETPQIADRLIYTGYVSAGGRGADRAGTDGTDGTDEVLVSAGGGAMGLPLLRAAIAARRMGCLVGLTWRVLAGPNLPEAEFAGLAADLPDRVVLERYRRDFPQLLRRCRVSVSQGGYNTTLDILAAGAAAVVVPFAGGDETEQSLRIERLAARGVLETVSERELSPERLAAAIGRAVGRKPAALTIDIGGAARSARLIAAMIRSGGRGMPVGGSGIIDL
ncbi:MAG TPA: glycosyltransferase [Stellaceae bacterium]|nr:glycosyltransferase [Stellaceae bacterium]